MNWTKFYSHSLLSNANQVYKSTKIENFSVFLVHWCNAMETNMNDSTHNIMNSVNISNLLNKRTLFHVFLELFFAANRLDGVKLLPFLQTLETEIDASLFLLVSILQLKTMYHENIQLPRRKRLHWEGSDRAATEEVVIFVKFPSKLYSLIVAR